jgi:hypothetical protein
MPDGPSLSAEPPSIDIDHYVILSGQATHFQRLFNLYFPDVSRKVMIQRALIDIDLSLSGD